VNPEAHLSVAVYFHKSCVYSYFLLVIEFVT